MLQVSCSTVRMHSGSFRYSCKLCNRMTICSTSEGSPGVIVVASDARSLAYLPSGTVVHDCHVKKTWYCGSCHRLAPLDGVGMWGHRHSSGAGGSWWWPTQFCSVCGGSMDQVNDYSNMWPV